MMVWTIRDDGKITPGLWMSLEPTSVYATVTLGTTVVLRQDLRVSEE